jgi:phage terminase large subunit GpA-like protein
MTVVLDSQVLAALRPRPRVSSWEWINQNGRDTKGRGFDGEKMPWLRGVCQAWDDPRTRRIVLKWGTRLGKTLGSHQLMACACATNPMPGLYGTATQDLAKRTVREKIYKILEQIEGTRWQLLPEHLRSMTEIRLTESTWPVVWSGSDTLLSDWPAHYGIANEVNKWSKRKSEEGDTLMQFFERFKDAPSHKILVECSPGVKEHCRIDAEFKESNQCQYHVPCPHCRHRQVLRLGYGTPGEGGIVFDKLADGRFDADLAESTARYVCESCKKEILDHHRPTMMRGGEWVPKGCSIDKRGRICGTPAKSCTVWGGQLSSLYSLQLTWGKIARAYVTMRRHPKTLQMFINGWIAETWEIRRIKSEPEQVAERLATKDPIGTVPDWATWLFAAADVQAEYFKPMMVAVGPNERFSIVDRGMCDTWEELHDGWINRPIPHADGRGALLPCLTLIDSGDGKRTKEVYDKCREWSRPDRLVLPCKGSNTDLGGAPFQKVLIGDGVKKGSRTMRRKALRAAGAIRIRVNSNYYEPILQKWLDERSPGDVDSLAIPQDLASDDEFIRELCNAVMSDEPSKMDPDRLLWVMRWASEPNDFRDDLKYIRCAVDVKFRGDMRVADRRQPSVSGGANVPKAAEVEKASSIDDDGEARARRPRYRVRRERTRRR